MGLFGQIGLVGRVASYKIMGRMPMPRRWVWRCLRFGGLWGGLLLLASVLGERRAKELGADARYFRAGVK